MAYKINLTDKQEQKLRQLVSENQDKPNVLKRIYCILLRNEGQSNENITKLLDIHEDTIADWTRIYLNRGLTGLLTFRYHKRRKSKLSKYKSRIKRIAGQKNVRTIEKLQKEIKQRFSLEVEYSWLYRYCKKNGIYTELRRNS